MLEFLKNRFSRRSEAPKELFLGQLELGLMQILWSRGEGSVRDAVRAIGRPLAYTTVMTTLDRLYKKGFLDRRKLGRAFLYSPRMSRQEWEHQRAGNLVASFLAGPQSSRELVLSSFLDAVGEHDQMLLDELEKRIRRKRKELCRRSRP